MKFALFIGLAGFLLTASSHAATIRVPADAPTIQAGIDLAEPGDQVLVALGTYSGGGNKNLDLRGKIIVVRSEAGPGGSIIDCEQSGRGFALFGLSSSEAVIDGFTIQNGNSGTEGGGGMFIGGGSPTISNCIFSHNMARGESYAGGGGGLVAYNATSLIVGCTFADNTVVGDLGPLGGGLAAHASALVIRDCSFSRNSVVGRSGNGGGLGNSPYSNTGSPGAGGPRMVVEDTGFFANRAEAYGGAVLVQADIAHCEFRGNEAMLAGGGCGAASSLLADCMITQNRSGGSGGGVTISSTTLSRCLIAENSAPEGGGIWIGYPDGTVVDCVIIGNVATAGGGANCLGAALFERCTFASNAAPLGGGVLYASDLPVDSRMENSIVAFNGPGAGVVCGGFHEVQVSCCDVFGNAGGDWVECIAGQAGISGNLAADPLFCSLAGSDFHLNVGSPCAPGQTGDCGLIGALPVGCGATAVVPSTWGGVKAAFRRTQ
jgi:hypothetical protein